MWSKRSSKAKEQPEEKPRFSRYYEHDGALRAYANRAMVLAFSCTAIALVSVALAAYVRIQPPTVIRVDANGNSAMVGRAPSLITVAQNATDTEPSDLEKWAFTKLFLDRYLTFSPSNVSRNWADALNMMTTNCRHLVRNQIEKDDLVGKVKDDQIRSEFHLSRLEASKESPLSFVAFGDKEVHRISADHVEITDKIVSEFHVRLVVENRSKENPSGLLVAEYWERSIEGQKGNFTLPQAQLDVKDTAEDNNPQ